MLKKVLKIVILTEKNGKGANFTQKSTQKCAQKENTQRKLDCSKKLAYR